jgi:hypothetical protein
MPGNPAALAAPFDPSAELRAGPAQDELRTGMGATSIAGWKQ